MGACAVLWPLYQDSASHVEEQLGDKPEVEAAQGAGGLKASKRDEQYENIGGQYETKQAYLRFSEFLLIFPCTCQIGWVRNTCFSHPWPCLFAPNDRTLRCNVIEYGNFSFRPFPVPSDSREMENWQRNQTQSKKKIKFVSGQASFVSFLCIAKTEKTELQNFVILIPPLVVAVKNKNDSQEAIFADINKTLLLVCLHYYICQGKTPSSCFVFA